VNAANLPEKDTVLSCAEATAIMITQSIQHHLFQRC